MQIVVERRLSHFVGFLRLGEMLKSQNFRLEMGRAVVDAGRKTRTQVRRAVAQQMAVTSGGYSGYVVPGTIGTENLAGMSYILRARAKGSRIQTYKGLRALSPSGRTAKRYNTGRAIGDEGFVRSGVWNNPRTFKRSFATGGGFFALYPSATGSARLPREFWTFGHKPDQPRDAQGRFASSGRSGFRVRRLYGPALGKELDKDASLRTFVTFAPRELEIQVTKRLEKFVRF